MPTVTYESQGGSILKYACEKIVVFGWLIPYEGAIFTFLELFSIAGGCCALCTLLAYISCDNNSSKTACIALPSPNTSYLTLVTLSSFVLSFFMNILLQRWWSVRTSMNGIIARSNNIMATLMGIFVAVVRFRPVNERRHVKELVNNLAKKVGAYLLTFFRLLLNAAREETSLQDLVDQKLLTIEEQLYFRSLAGGPPHASVLINILIQDAASNGLLGVTPECTQANLLCLQQDFQQLRGYGLDAMMYIDVQLPLAFIQIVCAVTYGLLVQLIYVCSSFISAGIAMGQSHYLVTGYITIILYSFVMLGLLKLFVILHNPLGYDAADYPANTYAKTLEGSLGKIRMSAMAILESSLENFLKKSLINADGDMIKGNLMPEKDKAGNTILAFENHKSTSVDHDLVFQLVPVTLSEKTEV